MKSEGKAIPKPARAFSPTAQKRREKALKEKRARIMQAALTLFSKKWSKRNNGGTNIRASQRIEKQLTLLF